MLVEFALVLPLLLVLLLGMMEFGRAFNYWIDETHLANVAARWASVDKSPGAGGLQEEILAEADTEQLRNGATVCINLPSGSAGKVGEPVEATVNYDFTWMPYISNVLGGITSTNLSASATMRIEQALTVRRTEC
ncbi:MAG TPA: TadE/TadG family type IV pilus assembly protein [Solirubrobacterales bacterium]|nr:TadE/TadG family type IV pilus assembly protein [Solirubrobacterales bacterium]